MKNPKDVLLKILETIGYIDDRGEYVNEFIKNVHLQSLVDLIQALPAGEQIMLKKQLSSCQDDPTKIAEVLKKNFSNDQIQKALEDAAKNAIVKYIEQIKPTLSATQKKSLIVLFQDLKNTQPQIAS